jgi:transcriptional regulator with XRE-family HTH domain
VAGVFVLTVAEQFGRGLRAKRRWAGYSQEGLAKAAGLHRSYVGYLENGRSEPRLGTVLRLADALGLEAADLIAGVRQS